MSAVRRPQLEGQASHRSPTIADLQSPPLEHQLTEEAQAAEAAAPDTEASQAETRQAMTGVLQGAHRATAGAAAVRHQADQATVPAEARATAEEALAADTAEAVRAEAADRQAEEDKNGLKVI